MPNGWFQRSCVNCLLLGLAALWSLPAQAAAGYSPPDPQEHSGQPSPPVASGQTDSALQQDTDVADQLIRDVFEPLQRGMHELSFHKVLAIFDKDSMSDYASVRDQIQSFFNRYQAVNFRYQLLQVTSDKDQASATAQIDMDASPTDENQMMQRRSVRMRFEMKLTPQGWRVIGFHPSDFFAQ